MPSPSPKVWVLFPALIAGFVRAQEPQALPELVISDNLGAGLRLRQEEINRVERLTPQRLERKQAQTFSQAIDNERGIDAMTSCAFCGAKRVTINGLRGEHTTILIDGLPLHSTVSSFYGVDAIPLGGIDSIDVFRGAGSALVAPESIGGAIQITTKEIVATGTEATLSVADDGQNNGSVVHTQKFGARTGLLLGAQLGESVPVDVDRNRVAELPRQATRSALAKFTHRFSAGDDLSLRFSYAGFDTIGGAMSRNRIRRAVTELADSDDFRGRDVRNTFIGDVDKITDNVRLDRFEAAAIHRHQVDEDTIWKFSAGGALQNQDAVYSHGYDYRNRDLLWVGLFEYQTVLNERHLLTVGVDTKQQHMDSSSRSLYQLRTPPLPQDDLSYRSYGGFIQDTWFANEANEISAVLRVDHIRVTWSDLERELERPVLAPRIFYKHLHGRVLTSRISYGLGYRAPLTLFESQHGTDHNGFQLDIDRFETAHSLVYSLAGQREDDFFEITAHATRLENMAYGVDRVGIDQPTLFENSRDPYLIASFDVSYGRRILPNWTLEGLFETFHYPSGYKQKLPVAAIEQRLTFLSNVEWGSWSAAQTLTVIGPRRLNEYGYGRHYNRAFRDEDVLSPTFGETTVSAPKGQEAPLFFTVDLTLKRRLSDRYSVSLAVLNVFDYTQTRAGDSPLTFELHGDHYHLDNFHIWGPLRGRQVFANFSAVF